MPLLPTTGVPAGEDQLVVQVLSGFTFTPELDRYLTWTMQADKEILETCKA